MKTASWHVAAIWLTCPECGSALENAYGSQMFTEDDISQSINRENGVIPCWECGAEVKSPTWPKQGKTTRSATSSRSPRSHHPAG